jgi:hypothetical protein
MQIWIGETNCLVVFHAAAGVRTQVISRSFMMGTSKSRAPSALEGEIAGGRDDIIAGSLLPYALTKKQVIRSGTRMTSFLEELIKQK